MQPSQLQPIQLSPPQISSQQQPQAFRQSEHAKIEASIQAKAIGNVNSPQDSGTIGHGSKQKRYCTKEQIYNHDIIYINSDEFSSSPSFLKMSYQNTPVLVKRMNSLNANNAVNCCQESHNSEKLINNKLFSTISCNYKSTDLVEQYDMDGNAFNQTKQLPNHRQNIQTQITKGNMENTMKVGRNGKENNENIQHVRYKTRRTSSLAQVDLNNYNLQNLIQLVDNMYERAVDKKIQCNIQVSLSAKKLANISSAIQKQECPRQSKIIEKQPVFIEIQKLKLMRKCREECKQKYGNNRSGKLEIDEQQIIKEEDEQDRGPTMTQRISIQILPDGEDADYRCIEEEEDAQQCYSRGASSQLNSQLSSVHYQQIISEASSVEQNQNQNERKNKILKVTVKAADQKKQERCGPQLDNKQWESINNQMKKIRQHESNGKKNLIKAYMREPHHQNCHQNNYQTQQQSYSGFRQQTKQYKIENSCKYSYLDNQKSIKQCSVSQVDSSRRSRTDAKTKFNQQLTQRAKNYNFGQQPTNTFSKGQSQTNQTATAIHSHNYKGVYEEILSQYSTARLLAISKHQYINGQQSAAKAGMSAPKSQRSSSVSLKVQRQQMVKRDRRGDGGKGDWNMKQEQRGGRLNSERKLRSSSNPKQREVMMHNKDSSKFGLCFVGDNLEVCKIGGLARNLKYF